MNTKMKPQVAAPETPMKKPSARLYMESLHLVERLHRRLLDVIKDEFDRQGRDDVNAVQALLLFNIGNSELTAGELRSAVTTSAPTSPTTSRSSSTSASSTTSAHGSTVARSASA